MSYHVIITRVDDTSVRHVQGGAPSQVGKVTASRTFDRAEDAQLEADVWGHTGGAARFGPSDWVAEVRPGPAPGAPCGRETCSVLSEHRH